jgi:pimeloyl-ACP methyl ester carboxylesterase
MRQNAEQYNPKHRPRLLLLTMRFHFIVAVAVCLFWSRVEAEEYRYPYRDPYLATATTAILNAEGMTPRLKREAIHVPVLAGRSRLPAIEGRGEVSVALYRQDHPAPMLFVLAGIGSNAYFGLGTYFAWLFHQQGFHVVLLPSPMSWNFALAASRSGAPGYAPADARDLYDVMQDTLALLRTRYRVVTTRIGFLGASLGALDGAHLSVIDAQERKVEIDTYLLLNPPLDLTYALERVDEWNALQVKFGRDGSKSLIARALAIVDAFSTERRDDPAVFDRLTREFATFTREEIQFLLAKALQTTLPELVYVTEVIQDRDGRPTTRDAARQRILAANRVTFVDYAERLAVPRWKQFGDGSQTDLKGFARRGSLSPILERLRGNPRVHIVHNADDVLTTRQSIRELKQALGARLTVFPYGGHLGNLWYPDNRDYALRVLGAMSPRSIKGTTANIQE